MLSPLYDQRVHSPLRVSQRVNPISLRPVKGKSISNSLYAKSCEERRFRTLHHVIQVIKECLTTSDHCKKQRPKVTYQEPVENNPSFSHTLLPHYVALTGEGLPFKIPRHPHPTHQSVIHPDSHPLPTDDHITTPYASCVVHPNTAS
jgi:hypothetical protein